jgi:predicted AlkP superfamily phosphohydrolase/phosphomutase
MFGNTTRRDFLSKTIKFGAGLSLFPFILSCPANRKANSFRKKIVILGIDGMDPSFLQQFVTEGSLPNFLKLIRVGSFTPMHTSIPPQSPVAWADFAVGANSRVHGLFDFIHRDPATMTPYFSGAKVSETDHTVSIGGWEIPLSSGTVKQLREGKPFWDYLGEAGIPTTIFKMPTEFPARCKDINTVSGIGTPDLLGTYGIFSFYTSYPIDQMENITGGRIIPVTITDNQIDTFLAGPVNTLKKGKPTTSIPFTVWRDPNQQVAKIKLQGNEILLKSGEWSDWIRLSFNIVPHVKSVKGICRIFIKQIHPHFEMYISPINIDPVDQALPVTCPESYGRELVESVTLFDTKGLPADTKALSYDILSEEAYLQMSDKILNESRRLMNYEFNKLRHQHGGVLFFYYSNLDQDSHMYWRAMDPKHPLYTPDLGQKYSDTIKKLYVKMDDVLGDVVKLFNLNEDNFTLIVMSDHGFAPFYRSVNLNTWLLQNGYITLIDASKQKKSSIFYNVDWSKTKADGLGINALYINMLGREKYGVVAKSEVPALVERLKRELMQLRDPLSGQKAITNIWSGPEIYNRQDNKTPDVIIGWNKGYRASWETVIGGFPTEIFEDNDDKWSGDHCIDPTYVPASFLINKKIVSKVPALPDVTATILSLCDIPIPKQMTGESLIKS